ncbi:hypothetical protein HanPSC8_Chr01g0001871 [Helianthus annuus]|nr:hypothetical protein HanPSC8_Chr01g0001871 [Helianthus annuus]
MDGRPKPGETADGDMHDRGKPPNLVKDFSSKPIYVDGAEYMNEPLAEELSTPGTAPIRGIGLRVTNIEGNNLMPRRGMYSTSNVSILDGLMNISKPVDNSYSNVSKIPNVPVGVSGSMPTHVDTGIGASSSNMQQPMSYANVLQARKEEVRVNFRKMESDEVLEGAEVVIPLASVKQVTERFSNTLYGYFLGKRLAFPVVDYFVKQNWKKYGLNRLMMNSKGFFFFKFKDKKGIDQLLEDGPWMIRNVPIILKEWSPSVTVEKEEITTVPVWVKMHDVPLPAFTEDGLSLLASRIGTPKMLDSYTATMCMESWGRSSFARALIDVHASNDLKTSITMAIPSLY